jgi:saccharopine dehydrogenase-like NADP-dependent oxidoreductase
MKVLVFGIGLQGRAVVHDLARSGVEVLAADANEAAARSALGSLGCGTVPVLRAEVSDWQGAAQVIRDSGAGLVVCMVPPALQLAVARAALDSGAHFVSTSYAGEVGTLHEQARAKGLSLLPEIGLDPGIDLVMARAAVGALDQVHGLRMYGGGIPERAAAGNPLGYKITWTFEGVLGAYRRAARLLRDGQAVSIDGESIFQAQNVATIELPETGALEAYPNGDALPYAGLLGLGEGLRELGRYALRWPGHSAWWRVMASLGFLRDEPIEVEGALVAPRKFVARLLEPQLQFGEGERDLAILRVHAWGTRQGRAHEVTLDLVDRRDLATGLFAMNRTVGYAASIGAQMLLRGELSTPGLLSPARDIPPEPFFAALRARGMLLRD